MNTEIQTAEPTTAPAIPRASAHGYLTDPSKFEHIWRIAKCFAMSALTPDTLRGKPEDCFILCQLAMRLDVDPFMLMQSTYVVHGRPGMEAKLQIGLLNASGRIRGNIQFKLDGDGDKYGCTATVIDAASGEKVTGPRVDMAMVKAEGWLGKNGSKWKTMPDVMFRYRAASLLIRTHYPEVTLGLLSREELEDAVIDVEHTMAVPASQGGGKTKSEALIESIQQQKAEATAEPAAEPETSPEEPQDVAQEAPKRKRGRKPKAEEKAQEEPPQMPDDADAPRWYGDMIERLKTAATLLDVQALANEAVNDPRSQQLSPESQNTLAEAIIAAQHRAEQD